MKKKKKSLLFCSFFFDSNSIGQSKAKCSMQLLQEMNPDVSSDYLDESIETILTNNPEFFNSFKVVIASSLKEKTLIMLSRLLWSKNIAFVYCRSIGFIASTRLQFKEHAVVETHPDNKQCYLRLEQPFESLEKYLNVRFGFIFPFLREKKKQLNSGVCINRFQSVELNHKVPWIVVVYKFLQKWQRATGLKIPTNYKEKCALKQMIQSGMCFEQTFMSNYNF